MLPSNKTFIWLVKNSSSILEISEHGLQSRTGSTKAIRCKWTLQGVQFLQKMFPHLRQWCWNKLNIILWGSRFRSFFFKKLTYPAIQECEFWLTFCTCWYLKKQRFLKKLSVIEIIHFCELKIEYLRIQNPLRFCKFPWRRVTRSRTYNLQTTFGVGQSFSSRILHNVGP